MSEKTQIKFLPALVMALVLVTVATACGGSSTTEQTSNAEATEPEATDEATDPPDTDADAELFPDVLDATLTPEGGGSFTVAVTLSSPYDSPERYADAWRVSDLDGNELGIRILGHDHASEQPFTRSQSGIEIPTGVEIVLIEGRDQLSGWGGASIEVAVPQS